MHGVDRRETESSYFYLINRIKRIPSASTAATEISLPFVSGAPANVEKEETTAKSEKMNEKKKRQWKERELRRGVALRRTRMKTTRRRNGWERR